MYYTITVHWQCELVVEDRLTFLMVSRHDILPVDIRPEVLQNALEVDGLPISESLTVHCCDDFTPSRPASIPDSWMLLDG